MNLYIWNANILGSRYLIYALANNLDDAKKIAIEKATDPQIKPTVEKTVKEQQPIIHDSPTSFIMASAPQLI